MLPTKVTDDKSDAWKPPSMSVMGQLQKRPTTCAAAACCTSFSRSIATRAGGGVLIATGEQTADARERDAQGKLASSACLDPQGVNAGASDPASGNGEPLQFQETSRSQDRNSYLKIRHVSEHRESY